MITIARSYFPDFTIEPLQRVLDNNSNRVAWFAYVLQSGNYIYIGFVPPPSFGFGNFVLHNGDQITINKADYGSFVEQEQWAFSDTANFNVLAITEIIKIPQ